MDCGCRLNANWGKQAVRAGLVMEWKARAFLVVM